MTQPPVIICTVSNVREFSGKGLFAMVDVYIAIDGIGFSIQGVQARRTPSGEISVCLPTFKDANGKAKAAIVLLNGLQQPLCDAVLAFLADGQLSSDTTTMMLGHSPSG